MLAALVLLPTCFYRYGPDQALYHYVGTGWLHGYLPYRDLFDVKPPAIFALYGALSLVFQGSQAGIRVAELLCVLGVGWLSAHAAVGDEEDGLAGSVSLLLAAFFAGAFAYGDTAGVELWEGAALVASFTALGRARTRPWLLLAGALAGVAVLFKLTALLPASMLAFQVVWGGRRAGDAKARLLALSWFAAGVGAPLCVTALYFAMHGAFSALVEWAAFVRYYAAEPLDPAWTHSLGPRVMLSRAGLWLGFCLALALVGCWPRAVEQDGLAQPAGGESGAKWALALLFAGAASVVVQRRYFTYHALVLAPLAVLAAAFGLRRCLDARRRTTLTLHLATVGCALVWGSSSSYAEFVANRLLPYARGRITEREYDRSFRGLFAFDYETSAALAAIVLSRAPRKNDGFHVRGYETPSYVLTGLRSPTRFFMEGYVSGYYAGFDPSWAEAHEAQLQANPPRFFAAALDERAEIARLEREGYGRIGARGRFLLFERGIEPRPMEHAAVVSAAADHTFEGTAFGLMPLALQFSADGTAHARVDSSSYEGSWRVSSNGQLCFTPRDGSDQCALVYSRPWGFLAFSAENHEICAVSEKR